MNLAERPGWPVTPALVDTRHEYGHLFSIYLPIGAGVFALVVIVIVVLVLRSRHRAVQHASRRHENSPLEAGVRGVVPASSVGPEPTARRDRPARRRPHPGAGSGRRRSSRHRSSMLAGSLVLAVTVSGCGKQSILSTHSKPAHDIAVLWWWMLGAATVVFVGAMALLVIAWFKRGSPGLPFVGEREDLTQGMVLTFGIAIPLVALVALFGVSDVYLVGQTSPPNPKTTTMTIDVIGHQWWWEVRYDNGRAVTANEIHIPTNTRVNVVATSADVIHSFWVPALNRKIDMIPGIQNRVLLETPDPGVYRGQCSQFCGFQHAHMGMYVFAQPPAAFRSWLAGQEQPAVTPGSAQAQAGKAQFTSDQCASCHTIAGTAAQGDIGPNLTHVASRATLAAAEIPNRPAWLAAWIRNPQAIKPGDRMPDLGLDHTQISDIVAYLDTLK